MNPNQSTVDYLLGKTSIPSDLRTAQWDRVPLWIRERAFFMAGVDDAETLARFRTEAEAIAAGDSSLSESRLRLRDYLMAKGYQPEPGEEGTLKDLLSVRRMNVALETNVEMARGYGNWLSQQGAILAFPARRYHRGKQARVPRDWPARWQAAIAATAPEGATAGTDETNMIALLNHPLWSDAEFNRFGTPYTPFDFGSGMMTTPVSRTQAKALGLIPDRGDESEQAEFLRHLMRPQSRAFNDGLEVTPAVQSQALRDALANRLQGFAEWRGDRLRFTDPNGTRQGTVEEIAAVITAPLPVDPATEENFPQMQADALDTFAEDPEKFAGRGGSDQWSDFARLLSRVMDPAPRDRFLRSVAAETLDTPPWLLAMVRETAWRAALEITERVPRLTGLLRTLRTVFN